MHNGTITRLLAILLSAAFAACAATTPPAARAAGSPGEEAKPAGQPTLVILFTNDHHGHERPFPVVPDSATAQTGDPGGPPVAFPRAGQVGGMARLAHAVRQVREEAGAERVLLLHGGDAFADTMLGNLTRGEAMVRLMNELGYDLMALGNHDFDYGWQRTRELAEIAAFPMRAANVLDDATGDPVLGDPFVVRNVGGVRVGVLALGYHNTPLTTAADNVSGLRFTDSLEAARRWVPLLERRADLVVILSHAGTEVDELIAREVEGIDLIVGAHSHDLGGRAEIAGVPIVQALSHGAMLGRADVHVGAGGAVRVTNRTRILWADEIPEDPAVAALVTRLRAPHRPQLEAPVAVAAERVSRSYQSESPFDLLVGEILVQATGAELSLLPGVGYGVAVGPGTVTREQLVQLLPHPSRVVSLELTGRQIVEILEQSARNIDADDPRDRVGGLVQAANVSWTVDFNRPAGQRVSAVAIGGRPLEPDRRYRVATHSGMMGGLHRYTTFARGTGVRETGREVVDVVAEALGRRSPLTAPPGGNVTRIERR